MTSEFDKWWTEVENFSMRCERFDCSEIEASQIWYSALNHCLTLLDSPEMVVIIGEAITENRDKAEGHYCYRRTMDKSGYEVIYWPDPEVAANDRVLLTYKDSDDAAIECQRLQDRFLAKAALSEIRKGMGGDDASQR